MRITNVQHTCPDIDKLIKYLREFHREPISNYDVDYVSDIIDIDYIVDTLEELRESNSSLRDSAHDYFHENEELEERISKLEADISELQSELELLEMEHNY